MTTEQTSAWVLVGDKSGLQPYADALQAKTIDLPALTSDSCLVETLCGSWEGNMDHALRADPVNICRQRKEPEVVLGNSGVVRVLKAGADSGLTAGQTCLIYGAAETDEYGYMVKALAYDAPGTVGVLARRLVLPAANIIPMPDSRHELLRWASFSVRYITAWGNLHAALRALRTQITETQLPTVHVGAWGGGTCYAEATLAQLLGHHASLITSSDSRLAALAAAGIHGIDRRGFTQLDFQEARYEQDAAYRAAYLEQEEAFMDAVHAATDGQGFHVIVDNIGTPIFRASLRALARGGVFATSGWKSGMRTSSFRAIETIQRHIHVHTHYATRTEAEAAAEFAETHDWLAPAPEQVWGWSEIPALAETFASGNAGWFPVFSNAD